MPNINSYRVYPQDSWQQNPNEHDTVSFYCKTTRLQAKAICQRTNIRTDAFVRFWSDIKLQFKRKPYLQVRVAVNDKNPKPAPRDARGRFWERIHLFGLDHANYLIYIHLSAELLGMLSKVSRTGLVICGSIVALWQPLVSFMSFFGDIKHDHKLHNRRLGIVKRQGFHEDDSLARLVCESGCTG
jgi:hypothetical protein